MKFLTVNNAINDIFLVANWFVGFQSTTLKNQNIFVLRFLKRCIKRIFVGGAKFMYSRFESQNAHQTACLIGDSFMIVNKNPAQVMCL